MKKVSPVGIALGGALVALVATSCEGLGPAADPTP